MSSLGVCSWSLRAEGPHELVREVRACGLDAIQLALEPLRSGSWNEGETLATLRASGITILSGMMSMAGEDYTSLTSIRETGGLRPDDRWPENRRAADELSELAERADIRLVTFHAGFLPEDPDDPLRSRLLDRLAIVCDAFARRGVESAFETGQETAATLAAFLEDLGDVPVGINFDPANMILYGTGDPIRSLRELGPHVKQIHLKDAVHSDTPGTWGREVPLGEGDVDWKAFAEVIRADGIDVDLVIERESGDRRTDVRRAAKLALEWVRA